MDDTLFDLEDLNCLHCGRPLQSGKCPWCDKPVKPYRTADGERTIGWSGSDTSHDRAKRTDAAANQATALRMLAESRSIGITVKDLREEKIPHHGTASGTLSNLHKAGKIARLRESRDRCKVYVLPEFVNGRETESQGKAPDVHPHDDPDRRAAGATCPNGHRECDPAACPICEQP
jgi:hypothetical protein